jgi:uncharacterized repeat protein (TIGR02543 family)
LTSFSYSPSDDPFSTVTATYKRYFTPSVVTGHDYTFGVTVVDAAGQKSSTSGGNSGAIEYTVTFDLNDPVGTILTSETNFPNVTMALPTPARTGYVFGGWNTSSGGTGASYTGTTIVNSLGPATLYAQWTQVQTVGVTVTLGTLRALSFSAASTTVASGSTLTITPTFSNGTNWQWYVDGLLSSSAATFSSSSIAVGVHNISATVTDTTTGISYSGFMTVTVTP